MPSRGSAEVTARTDLAEFLLRVTKHLCLCARAGGRTIHESTSAGQRHFEVVFGVKGQRKAIAMKAIDVSFVILKYYPKPNLPELGDHVGIALAVFETLTSGRVMMIRKDYVSVVKEFGCVEDVDFVTGFLNTFKAGFDKCARPDQAVAEIRQTLQDANDVLQISDITTLSVPSLDCGAAQLGSTYLDCREGFGHF